MKLHPSHAIFLLLPIIWPVFITTCLVFWIYRKLVDITLRIKLGQRYGGLLNLMDAYAIFDDNSKFIISTVSVYKCNHEIDLLSYIKERVQKEIFDNPEDYAKISGTLHRYKGYAYWLKNTAKLEECVKVFSVPQNGVYDEEYVKTIAGELYNSPLPHDNTAIWDINVCEKPMVSKLGKECIYRYPVIIRLHHVIGDGITVFSFLDKLLADGSSKGYNEKIFNKLTDRASATKKNLVDYLKELLKPVILTLETTFYIIFVMFQKRLELIHWREKDDNVLHGPELSGEKIFVWRAEEKVKFVPMVKNIKNTVPHAKFSHVVFSAIAGSFHNYFKKKGVKVPDMISTYITFILNLPKMDFSKPVPLQYTSSAAMLELPVNDTRSLVRRLYKVRENADKITYFEQKSNMLFLKYVIALFPINIRSRMHDASSHTAILSTVPAGSLGEIMEGCFVEKTIACVPTMRKIGVTFCVITYDDRFQVGLLVDKRLISSQQEAQEIVDDVYRNFELLYNEAHEIFKSK